MRVIKVMDAGSTTILITDLSASAKARASSDVLRWHCHSPAPFTSFPAAATLMRSGSRRMIWRGVTLTGEQNRLEGKSGAHPAWRNHVSLPGITSHLFIEKEVPG